MNDFWHVWFRSSWCLPAQRTVARLMQVALEMKVAQATKIVPAIAPAMILALTLAIVVLASGDRPVAAQEFFGGQPTPEQIQKMQEMRGRMRGRRNGAAVPPPQQPAETKPEQKDDKKKEEGEKKKEEEIKTIKRPTDGSGKLDPNRVRLLPDANGFVQFNYSGHPWADVLQEFADAAKFSFDWQELPADNLNLVTQKKYTLQQARDLLNGILLARGFTLVVQGEVLSAVKIEKLDPSLVPRIEADDLEDYPPHDFVRVRFQLPRDMDPAKAKDDVQALLSPKAKVIPLLNTKRLLVIDSVANQRSVRDLIYAEQSAADSIVKPEIYHIRYRRADYVAEQVMVVLGLDPSSRKKPQELQLETQRMQLFMQMQQKGKDVSKLLSKEGPAVHIAVDTQQNTILINAPPELVSTIERTIEEFDRPPGGGRAGGEIGRSMKRHKVASASTDAIVTALMEIGNLDPLTQLQSDSESKILFAFATEADHQKIEQMIGKLDGSGREIHVIWLRRLPVRQVAGTLTALLVGEEKKKEDNSSRRRFSFYGMNNDDEKEEVGFKAQADVENNRLILWANADELIEVRKMLVQLGESPAGESRNPNKVRVLKARSPEETARLLERLKSAYPGKLNVDDHRSRPKRKQEEQELKDLDKVTLPEPLDFPPRSRRDFPQRSKLGSASLRTVQLESTASSKPDEQAEVAPAVNVVVTEDGRIVLSSDDPAALNELEELLTVIEPPRQEFHKFSLKHASALNVVIKLEKYFADELKDQTESVFDQWGEYEGDKAKELGPATLGRSELLRFLDDRYTNTVIVQGANAAQLIAIEQLIKVYDQPPKSDLNYYARKTEVIPLTYSRAQDIAKSLKEVYRELLSSKDKEFQDKEGNQPLSGRAIPYAFGEVRKNQQGEEDPVLIEFEGVLSIGVDEVSNSLIISAREEVLGDIKETVRLLDNAATPNTMIHVHRVGGGIRSASELQKMLKGSLSQPWPGGKPLQPSSATQGGSSTEQQQPPRERSDDNGRRRRGR